MVHAKRTTAGEELTKSEKLLKVAAQFLSHRDFTSCRCLALKARESDPEVPGADQVLAIADVLLASGREYPTDWYSVLQIPRPGSGNPVLVRTQFEKLRALLAPSKNRFAFSQEAFELVHKAWSFLSYPGKKTHLGNGSESGSENGSENGPKTPKQRGKEEEVEVENGGDTFWTVCPYCYYIYEYKKMYEDCCLRCQCCRKAFHGVPIEAPKPSIMVPGKEQYYFCFGCVKMEYVDPEGEKKAKGINKEDEGFMVISDSDDDGGDGGGGGGSMGADSGNAGSEKTVQGVVGNGSQGGGGSEGRTPAKRVKMKAGRRKGTNLKSVAMRNTKTVMGNGMRSRRIGMEGVNMSVDGGNGIGEGGNGSGNGNGGLEFLDGDDDVFVGIDVNEDLW